MNIKTKITAIHYQKDPTGIIFGILKLCSFFYELGADFKNYIYDKQILTPKKVNAYVISVGNFTTGGVGKTPVVAEIAKYYVDRGEKTAIISRGYGGRLNNKDINVISDGVNLYYNADMAGDEPYWLAVNLNMCAVITCANRYKACKYAVEQLGITKIILDDGFQHRKLYRNLDVVLVDSDKQFGNGFLLPAGPLREKVIINGQFNRVNKLIVMSKNTNHKNAEEFVETLKLKTDTKTDILLCKTEPDYVYNIISGQPLDKGGSITALSAIGQPEQFYSFLKNDYDVKQTVTFDDHHLYTLKDIADIDGDIVTTEKDAVKLAKLGKANIYALKLKTRLDIEKLLEA